jgi:hypothetical protein
MAGVVTPADADEAGTRFAGRPLAEALEELRQDGLKLIFSSDLVTPDLIVRAEPRSRSPKKIAAELLAPFGLKTEPGPGGTLLVVRDDRKSPETTSSIRGTVRDSRSDAPLKGARIEVVSAGIEVVSGDDGGFEIPGLPAGSYKLKVRLPGYVVQEVDHVRVVAARPTTVVLRLLPSPELVEAVVVTPSRFSLYGDAPASKQSLTKDEIQQTPHLADDVNRVVARLPGIANPDISSQLFVRGGVNDEVLYVVDGMQLYAPFHFEPGLSLFSIISSKAVENVDLSTGGFAARYGDRMSGVLSISTVRPSTGNRNSLGVSFLNAHFTTEGSFAGGRGEWFGAIRRGYLDLMLDLVGSKHEGSGPTYGDVLGKVRYRVTDRSSLEGRVLYAASQGDQRNTSGAQIEAFDLEQENTYAWATLETAFSPGLHARTILFGGRLERNGIGTDIELGRWDSWAEDFRTVDLAGIKQDWTVKPARRHYLAAGFEARHQRGDYDFRGYSVVTDLIYVGDGDPVVTERESDLTVDGWSLSAYASDRFRVLEPLTLEFGLRWDLQTYTDDDSQLSPRFGLLWEASPRDNIRFAAGVYRQSQWIHELQVHDGVEEFWPAQRTNAVVLGYERRFDSGLSVGAEIYRKDIVNPRPRFENFLDPLDGITNLRPDRIVINPERGRADGIELFARMDGRGRVRWWFGYVLSRAQDLVDGAWVYRSWDQTHAVTGSVNYRIGKHWNFNAAGLYHTGWPTTTAWAEFVMNPDGTWYFDVEHGPLNGARFDDYHRLDVRASRTFPNRRGSVTLFLEVINLLQSENPCCGEYGFIHWGGGNVSTERDVTNWLPTLPSFGVNWEF